jgi:predicted ATPase/DNA-binding winged helix-turn-helix (wHTH) protein
MGTEEIRPPVYVFGGWEIDLARRELRSRGVPVQLGGRAFEIMAELAKATGELVSKNDLMDRVWPGAIVEDNALQVHIAAIRKALGSDRGLLKTAFGRGYRLLGSWAIQQEAPVRSAPANDARRTPAKRAATNLPVATSELIGRGPALDHLQELLSAYRLVTLVGPGGIGKSALAVEVARSVAPGFQGDVSLVELAALADPLLVPLQVARALGVRLHGNDTSPEAVAHAVGERKLLIILDNCEHLVDASAGLAEAILSRCPSSVILATSREVLRVSGEYVYRVPPLDVPPVDGAEANGALRHAAVQLFVARARALGADLAADETNLDSIATICRRLDGIPLALELAAARAAMLGAQQVAALLDDRFAVLTGGRRTALPRHQTLRLTLDWSFNLLPAAEAGALTRLALFAGQFPMDGAIAVAEEIQPALVRDHVTNLVAKSLVAAELRHQKPYYRLLDTTRAYALEKLHAGGEFAETAQRLARYCLAALERSEADSGLMLQPDWLAAYAHLIDNVRASLDWAFGPQGDPDLGIALTTAALPLWVQLSLLTECRERAERALAKLTDATDIAQRQRMQLSAALGWSLMYGVGRAREAGRTWATTLELADRLDDRDHRLRALWGLCIDQFNNGDFLKALEFAHRFADETRHSTDPVDPMMADRLLATTLHYMGDQTSARRHIDRVLAGLAEVTFKAQIIRFQFDLRVSTHYFQARILWLQGAADQALAIIEHNIEEGRALGHAMTFCSVLGQAACTISFLAGDLDAAGRYCAALLEHTQRYPIRPWQLWARCFEGLLAARRGDMAAGLRTMRRELDTAGEARFLPRFSLLTGEFAAALGETGETAEGLATVNEILTRSIARKEQWYVSELLRIKGELLLKERPRSSAAADYCFDESLDLARRQGARFWELRSALSMARQKIKAGHNEAARALLAPASENFVEAADFADLRAARGVLGSLNQI